MKKAGIWLKMADRIDHLQVLYKCHITSRDGEQCVFRAGFLEEEVKIYDIVKTYCIILSYNQEILHRISSDIISLTFSFSPQPPPRDTGGKIYAELLCYWNILREICQKSIVLNFARFYKLPYLKNIDPLLKWKPRRLRWAQVEHAENLWCCESSSSAQ